MFVGNAVGGIAVCMFTVTRTFTAGCTRTASNITNYSAAVPQSVTPLAVVMPSTRYTITAKSGYNKVGKQTRLGRI
jgi:hypothetical protein